MRRIHLGSGDQYKEGWINIDFDKGVKADIYRDLEKGLPFDDDSVDEVFARHFVEHIKDDIFLMNEIYRVCKDGATVTLEFPFSGCISAHDWGHKSYWNPRKIHYLKRENRKTYMGLDCNFKIVKGTGHIEGEEPYQSNVIVTTLTVVK